MSFSCGIVGLPNSGKSTIFNALTSLCVPSQPYPFCTIEPNVGIVPVPDERLTVLGEMFKPDRLTPTTIEFIDIAGLIKDAHKGEGLGNKFLGQIRAVDAIAHVVRLFGVQTVPHVYDEVDPKRDLEIVEAEIIISDLEIVEERLDKIERLARISKDKGHEEKEILERIRVFLNRGQFIDMDQFSESERELIRSFNLITAKPLFYIANIDENNLGAPPLSGSEGAPFASRRVVSISGKLEEELVLLSDEERRSYLDLYSMEGLSIGEVIRVGYDVLGLVTFFTVVGKEVRAWTVPAGTACARAAGKIHTDMEKGFIKAEVINFEDLLRCGSEHAARDKGLLRIEGRDYPVKDGDILHIRFNV